MDESKPVQKDFQLRLLATTRDYPWLFLALFMFCGALLGFAISFLKAPVYEAQSTIVCNLEIVRNSQITEIMVDSQLNHVGELMFFEDIINEVIKAENEVGNAYSLEDLRNNSQIERRLMTTVIKVRDEDPAVAARIATNWAKFAFERLNEAYPHAVKLSDAKMNLFAIGKCLNGNKELALCADLTIEKIENIQAKSNAVILEESPLSLGLTRDLNLSLFTEAPLPGKVLSGGHGSFVLIGALMGMVVGLVFNEVIPLRKSKHD